MKILISHVFLGFVFKFFDKILSVFKYKQIPIQILQQNTTCWTYTFICYNTICLYIYIHLFMKSISIHSQENFIICKKPVGSHKNFLLKLILWSYVKKLNFSSYTNQTLIKVPTYFKILHVFENFSVYNVRSTFRYLS